MALGDDVIKDYQLLSHLGSGGMGEVYLAHNKTIKKEVALKILNARSKNNKDIYARFMNECQLLGSLSHPNLVEIYHADARHDPPFFTMEYVKDVILRCPL